MQRSRQSKVVRSALRCVHGMTLSVWMAGVSAHHSHAEFSSELQVVEGELLSIAWRNPHPAMTLSVPSGGVEETWQIQVLGNINGLRLSLIHI